MPTSGCRAPDSIDSDICPQQFHELVSQSIEESGPRGHLLAVLLSAE